MTNGRKRFEYYLEQLESLINKASAEASPALWLYQNNARTVLFMLEALSKLYNNLHDESMFKKLRDKFKQLEDLIGDIDHYDSYIKQFSEKGIPVEIISYIRKKKEEAISILDSALTEEEWKGPGSKRIRKIRNKLDEALCLKEADEVNAIKKYYQDQIRELNGFYNKTPKPFTKLEDQVHEIRRKLRWLSIYPQALRGCVQLTEKNAPEEYMTKYFTPEIVNSPFNKLPEPNDNSYLLLLNKPHFLALSWIISELGKLKDKGLTIEILHEAASHTKGSAEVTDKLAEAIVPDYSIQGILNESSKICNDFFKEQNLDKLIHSVTQKNS